MEALVTDMAKSQMFLQLIRLQIDGVQYELFGPAEVGDAAEAGRVEALVFSDVVPAKAVIAYLTDMTRESSEEERKKMQ